MTPKRFFGLAAPLVALAVALTPVLPRTPALVIGVMAVSVTAGEAEARRSSSSSGGFSRPSAPPRTPSAAPSRPSAGSSGGFSRPSVAPPPSRTPPVSGADRDNARATSGRAMQDFQASQRPATPPPAAGVRVPEPAPALPAPAYQSSRTPSAAGGGGALPAFLGGLIAGQVLSPGTASSQPAPVRDGGQRGAPVAASTQDQGGGGGWIWILLLLALGAGAFWWFRRQRAAPAPAIETAAAAASGVRAKVGSMVMIDPSPFVLLGAALTVAPPVGGPTAIDAASTLTGGPNEVERLYLPADGQFIEIVRDAAGGIRQARWFGRLSEVHPADAAEWSFWLDAQDGMIGWPVFQTQDGQTWHRVWGSGGGRAQPMAWSETRESLDHQASRALAAMLYTRTADDGATQLFLLIAAADTGSESWVELHVGIDLNPVSLRLGAV